jgi:DNA-binding response OmpR family regulator
MKKIAIIEDEHPIAKMYELKLANNGYDVAIATNGHEGYDLIKEMRPDLVLLDLRMPEMTGDELLEKIRQTDWGAHPRVVVLTNISRDEAPSSLRLLGIDRYIVKAHHTPAEVVAVVDEILS